MRLFQDQLDGNNHSYSFAQISQTDFPAMESKIKQIVKEKQPFERLEMTKDELREMFAYNQFKLRIINEKIDTDKTTVYRCGPLIDLCRGPHVRHTGKVKACKVTKVSFGFVLAKNINHIENFIANS